MNSPRSQQIRDWRNDMSAWQSPEGMMAAVGHICRQVGVGVLHIPGFTFWREAWVASRFAAQLSAESVRLLGEIDRPDFALSLKGCQFRFEIVSADRPGRRMSAEYKEIAPRLQRGETIMSELPGTDWLTPLSIAQRLRSACAKKAGKYDSDVGLVIYLLGMLFQDDDEDLDLEPAVLAATALAGQSFASVWVLSGADRLWHPWKDRTPTTTVTPHALGSLPSGWVG